jgi:hypothetical protein
MYQTEQLATRILLSVIIMYDRLKAACCVVDTVDCLLPGLRSSMFSLSTASYDILVTYFMIFGLMLRNLE